MKQPAPAHFMRQTVHPTPKMAKRYAVRAMPWKLYPGQLDPVGNQADDYAQELVLHAFLNAHRLRDPKAAPAFFHRVLANRAKRIINGVDWPEPHSQIPETMPIQGSDPVDVLEAKACLRCLEKHLPEDDFQFLVQVAESDQTASQLAADMGIGRTWFYKILARARADAARILEENR